MVCPVIGVVDGHSDQSVTVSPGAADQNPPGSTGIARLHADAALVSPEELIVVLIGASVQNDLLCPHDLGKHEIIHCVRGQQSKLPGRRIMLRGIEAVRIGKVGVDKAKLCRPPVHCIGEGLHRAGMILCQRHRRIVAGVKQKAIEQLLHRAALPFPEIE